MYFKANTISRAGHRARTAKEGLPRQQAVKTLQLRALANHIQVSDLHGLVRPRNYSVVISGGTENLLVKLSLPKRPMPDKTASVTLNRWLPDGVCLVAGDTFRCIMATGKIVINPKDSLCRGFVPAVLHELGHAYHGHGDHDSDFKCVLTKEEEAWGFALKKLQALQKAGFMIHREFPGGSVDSFRRACLLGYQLHGELESL